MRESHEVSDPANTDFVGGNARLSDDLRYRYYLTRYWEKVEGTNRVCWVMLNPSTADAMVDDQTIKRCKSFSKAWGYDGIVVVNIFAFRTAYPAELARAEDPVGPENDEWIRHWPQRSDLVVAAWGGSYPKPQASRVAAMHERLKPYDPHVLGLTRAGEPLHPARLDGSLRPVEWRRP